MNKVLNKKIGIWGFGIVGKSVADFLLQQKTIFKNYGVNKLYGLEIFAQCTSIDLEIFDQRTLTDTEKLFITKNNISLASNKEQFLSDNDIIIPSPGVNIDAVYERYAHKWLCELDLFAHFFTKKIISRTSTVSKIAKITSNTSSMDKAAHIISITGTVGKTSVTKLLSDIISAYGYSMVMGGNIGIACLDLLQEKHPSDKSSKKTSLEYAVLEVSSYQLTHTQAFSPDIAIMTNFSPNHLDWHGSEEAYFKAKCAQFIRQTADQKALIPFVLKKQINALRILKSKQHFFSAVKPSEHELASLTIGETLFYIDRGVIMVTWKSDILTEARAFHFQEQILLSLFTHKPIISISQLPSITFEQNWLIICSVLYMMNMDLQQLPSLATYLTIPEHRLEQCGTFNNMNIYNDSKSTTIASTRAAIQHLHKRPIILILGGLSKGVDRAPFIAQLKNKVKKVYTFGAESEYLAQACMNSAISVITGDTLEEVVQRSMRDGSPGDQILFSPAGSSYDLFTDYVHRGIYFKELVNKYKINFKDSHL